MYTILAPIHIPLKLPRPLKSRGWRLKNGIEWKACLVLKNQCKRSICNLIITGTVGCPLKVCVIYNILKLLSIKTITLFKMVHT